MRQTFSYAMALSACLSFCSCKRKCILEGYYQVPAFLSLTPAKEEYKIGIDTIHLKVEIPYKSFTISSGTPIDIEKYKPNDFSFSVIPRAIINGVPDTIIPDPIGKRYIDVIYKGSKSNFAGRSWSFEKTDSSWLFSLSLIPVLHTLKDNLVLLRSFPIQYEDGCLLVEYPIRPFNTNPNWHLPMGFSPNNDYRPYAQDFYFMLK